MTLTSMENPLGGAWKWLMFFAVMLIAIGIVAMSNPLITVLATSVMLGSLLLLSGTLSVATGLFGKGVSGRWVDIVFGLLAIVAGIITLGSPIEGAVTLVWVIGALYAVSGFFELAGAFGLPRHKGWVIALGIIDIILGFWIMFMLPGAALLTLAFIVGLGFLIRGGFMMIISLRLRRYAQ